MEVNHSITNGIREQLEQVPALHDPSPIFGFPFTDHTSLSRGPSPCAGSENVHAYKTFCSACGSFVGRPEKVAFDKSGHMSLKSSVITPLVARNWLNGKELIYPSDKTEFVQ
eukprot:2810699-Amphidinium_carterae.1